MKILVENHFLIHKNCTFMFTHKTMWLLIAAMAIMFVSCDDDDDDSNSANSCPGSMSLTVDGSSKSVSQFNNTLKKLNSQQQSQSQKGRRMDLRTNFDGGTFVLSISNWEFQNPPQNGVITKKYSTKVSGPYTECEEIDNTNYCDEALATYTTGSTNYSSGNGSSSGFIEITNVNPSDKTVSGTFDVQVSTLSNNPDTMKMNGSFSNQCYRIIN